VDTEVIEDEIQAILKICKGGGHKNVVSMIHIGDIAQNVFIDMEFCDLNLDDFITCRKDQLSAVAYFVRDRPLLRNVTKSGTSCAPPPKVFMMPYDRNPHFLGRNDLLRSLRDKLQEIKLKQYIALLYMGWQVSGKGKSQLNTPIGMKMIK
jgi:hypothetical protein